ncbi:MAG: PBP1A family penicillin-binding protein [Actinobacteria bacterium]|nr:PBP1A family penicillin-binding protein [Actinomycetota bacterium]
MKRYILLALVGFFITVTLANAAADAAGDFAKDQDEKIIRGAQRSYIHAADGTILARLYFENREDVPLDEVPKHIRDAIIAIEDERFYSHNGVDYHGIARALLANIKSHRIVEGGSTITQQYIKNTFGEKDKTLARKLKEAILSYRLEKKYSKEEILEAYLNTIYFGQGAYGIEAAAQAFFGKKASEMTIAEGALLAGLTKSPLEFSPYFNPDKAFYRQAAVLSRMAKLGFITSEQAEAAKTEQVTLVPKKEEVILAPYFVEHVKQELIQEYGVEKVFTGGLHVYTTLDIRAQKNAENAIAKTLNRKKDPEAALISICPQNGYIVAMVGGRDFKDVKYNLAVQGKRQPGSSFKMFVLVTALEQGYGPNDRFNSSSPQVIKISPNPKDAPWKVRNCEGSGRGMMTLRDGSVNSVNTVYANVTMKVGAKNIVKTAAKMGIKTPLDPYPSIGIGGLTIGVSPLEMASAYGTLANGGVHVEPIAITKIVDFDGTVIKQAKPEGKKVMDSNTAYQASDILRGVVERGTATRARIGRPVAGKTGTNQLYRDAWFVGYTPTLVTAVWMGHPEAQISMYNVHGRRGFGGIIPATIWAKHMRSMVKGTPVLNFPKADWSKGDKGGSFNSASWISKTKALLEEEKEEIEDNFFQEAQEQDEDEKGLQAVTPGRQSKPDAPKPKRPKPAIKSKPEHGANIISQPETAYQPAPPSLPVAQPSSAPIPQPSHQPSHQPQPAPQPSPKPQPAPATPQPETPASAPAPVTSEQPSGNTGDNGGGNSYGRTRIPSLPRRHLQ